MDAGMRTSQHKTSRLERVTAPRQVVGEQGDGA